MHKTNLPYLNQERLNYIFEAVYDGLPEDTSAILHGDDKMASLLCTLKAMQAFNHWHRCDDTAEMHPITEGIFVFATNSEGPTFWLALILAIKELYGFSDAKMRDLLKLVAVRK